MICEGCDGKFGSNGEPEGEVSSEDVSDTSLSAEIEVRVPCGNCGGDFKVGYATIEAEVDVDDHDLQCSYTEGDGSVVTLESDRDRFREMADRERTFEVTSTDVEVTDDYRPKETVRTLKDGTVKRRPVPFRFQRHYYDITATFSVRCSLCSGDFEVTGETDISASELEAA